MDFWNLQQSWMMAEAEANIQRHEHERRKGAKIDRQRATTANGKGAAKQANAQGRPATARGRSS